MHTTDIKGHLAQLTDFATSMLGYDKVEAEFKVEQKQYTIKLDCSDEFQRKLDYSMRVDQELIYEFFDWETPLDKAVGEIYERLGKLMRREERELRCGLALIGKSLEAGASYRTHVGLEFVASMKREQEKTMLLLPDRTGSRVEAPPEDYTTMADDVIQPSTVEPAMSSEETVDDCPF